LNILQVDYAPVTVFFAPNALTAPNVPTRKYWYTLPLVSPPLDRYFAKLGIEVVFSLLPYPLNGLSKDDVLEASEMPRR